jgi:FkbM family methyltransferase
MEENVSLLKRLLRSTVKPVLQKIRAGLSDPIRVYSIEGMRLFAHEHEYVTRMFASYKTKPDTEKYNDFFFIRLLNAEWGACNLIDVGVNYGQDLLLLAAYKRNKGIPGEIIGFEPNRRTYELLSHTFRENGLEARFEHAALGERSGAMVLQGVKNNSQGMTTIGVNFPNLFEVVEVKTLDNALAHLLDAPCFLKLDTQGSEWTIMQGGKSFYRKSDLVIRAEYTPAATLGIDGVALLEHYLDEFVVIDAKTNVMIVAADKATFAKRVASTYPYGYTDLYLLPKTSPLVPRL